MQYFPNYPAAEGPQPDVWARDMEAQGWHGVCASDHFWVGQTRYPHVFVAATQMAMATRRVRITTSFCNNLFRSPVEFAQAALALQRASQGRFEAGLGAGWAAEEIEAMGARYPDGPTRVSMYVEALQIVRCLMRTGQCQFAGEHYQIRIDGEQALGPLPEAPIPLIASAGGPRALREVTPLVDRVEVKASARATRGGALDFEIMATVTEEEVRSNIDRVRAVRGDLPIGIFILVGTGDDPRVSMLQQVLGQSYLGRFVGEPESVAQAVQALSHLGVDRVQLTELAPGTVESLAPYLL